MTKNTTLWDKVKDFFKQDSKPELPNAFPVKSEKPVLDELLEKLDETGNVLPQYKKEMLPKGVLPYNLYQNCPFAESKENLFLITNPWENFLSTHKFSLEEADFLIPGFKKMFEAEYKEFDERVKRVKASIDNRVRRAPGYIAEINGELIFDVKPFTGFKDMPGTISIRAYPFSWYSKDYSIFGIDKDNRENPLEFMKVSCFRDPWKFKKFSLKEMLVEVYNDAVKELRDDLKTRFEHMKHDGFYLEYVEQGFAWEGKAYSYTQQGGLICTTRSFPIDEQFKYEVTKPKKYSHIVNVGDITLPRNIFENIKLLYDYDTAIRETGIVTSGTKHIKFEKENLVVVIEELPFNTTLEITKPDAWWNREIAFK